MNLKCLTCGILVHSPAQYHFHNVSCHNLEELSSTIVKFLFKDEQCYLKQNNEARKTNTSNGIFQECMDEVIELGTLEGEDNLTVQSLFLKSNFTPNSRHVIEVKEKKQPKDVIKALSEEFNAAVVRFQKDCLSTEMSGSKSKIHPNKAKTSVLYSPNKTKKRRTKNSAPIKRRETKRENREDDVGNTDDVLSPTKTNVKIVLRSGRTIKASARYEDFVYYDDPKENSPKTLSTHLTGSLEAKDTDRSEKNEGSVGNRYHLNQRTCSGDLLSSRLLDLFPDDFNFDDLNLSSELDIKVEDLDLPGFDDLEGTLPENQILTIENLLQELDGGGSIEISNIIKENNIDSDTLVLDALSQNCTKDLVPSVEGVDSPPKGLSQNCTKDLVEGVHSPPKGAVPHLEKVSSPQTTPRNSKKEKKFQDKNICKICSKSYANKVNFQNHVMKYHLNAESNKMLYRCDTCNAVFAFLAAFERHVKEHNPHQTFLCEVCGRNFKNLNNLKIHTALHKKTMTYQCHLCPCKYFLKYSYLHHLKTHTEQNKFLCQICRKTFSQKLHFQKHLEKHTTGKYLGMSNDLKCNYCNDIKPSSDISTVNFENCNKCKRGIYKKYLIENENYIENSGTINVVSKDKKECKICGKRVKNFNRHVRETHLSNPVVECDICGQSVKKACLNSHKYRRHKGVETNCDHCDKKFKNALALKEHLNKVKKLIT